MKSKSVQNYINHITFVIDESGSMQSQTQEVVKLFDNEVKYFARRSTELEQEWRVSVYLFNQQTRCIIYDMDVMRLPSLKDIYSPNGGTAMIDALCQSITDLKETPQKYGDHAFVLYAITDGEERDSRTSRGILTQAIDKLPDNWTFAAFVPDSRGIAEAKRFGIPASNIEVWDINKSTGVEGIGTKMREATETFVKLRSTGVRGSKSLFKVNLADLSSVKIENVLTESTNNFSVFPVNRDSDIRPFVESVTGRTYTPGSTYYQLTKKEEVQGNKKICVRDKQTMKIYSGDSARTLLGLPNTTVNLKPEDSGKYDIFIQSKSVNRKLFAGSVVAVNF